MLLSLPRLLQTERARFLDGGHQLLVQHGEGRVRREVQAIKASVSPAETHRERHHQPNSPVRRDVLKEQSVVLGRGIIIRRETN